MEQVIGSVRIDDQSVTFLIQYGGDAAVLEFSVSVADGAPRYVPIFASTFRGLPTAEIDVFVSKSREELWITSAALAGGVLAYHRFGTNSAITGFGEKPLLDSAAPRILSGGPVPFPALDMAQAVRMATFYLQGPE